MSSTQSTQSISGGDRHCAIRRPRARQSAFGESRAVQQLCELPVDLLEQDLSQPSRHFDEAELAALAESVREHGVLEPVLVRPRPSGSYQLIAGQRQLCAARIAGLQTIPSLVCQYDDAMTLEEALIENMKRDYLSLVEEARACATLVNEFGLSYMRVADRVGRSGSGVSNLMSLLKLSEEILDLIERGELGMCHGRALLKARDPVVRAKLARKAAKQGWAAKKGWSASTLEARARLSNEDPAAALNEDVPVPLPDATEQEQYPDETSRTVARAWGDVLGTEVRVRVTVYGRVRIEVRFNSPDAALDAARRLDEVVSRGSSGT
jgi:ParB family chromosome partitioning protein